jgi:polysaccharide export outer membrane protein
MEFFRRPLVTVLVIGLLAAVVDGVRAQAQPQTMQTPPVNYRIGAGDRIFLSVPQRTDLNRELVVDENGRVTLPLIGEIQVGGLTAQDLESRLLLSIRDYYPSIETIVVSITQALSQVIYITGQVTTPGKYTFPAPPKLWGAIREAGGPLSTADLDRVRIIKDRSRGGTSTVINVQQAIEFGTIEDLPDLDAGDTIIIPALEQVYTGSFGVNVIGAVATPGVYRLKARQDLISAVLLAGGPIPEAKLDKLNIIRPNTDGTIQTLEINLNKYLHEGDPFSNPVLRAGDTVNVPRISQWSYVRDPRLLVSFLTATVSLVTLAVALTAND